MPLRFEHRRFDKAYYKFHSFEKRKKDADDTASRVRRAGGKARIVKTSSGYYVYVRR